MSSEKLPILTASVVIFLYIFLSELLSIKSSLLPFQESSLHCVNRLCNFAQASGFAVKWNTQPIVSLPLFANDGFSQWQTDTGRGQTILQSKKGLESSLAPTLPTDRIMFKPFYMEKGITKSPPPPFFFLKRVLYKVLNFKTSQLTSPEDCGI